MTRLRVLLLGYPLVPVSPEACGGTEQVLYRLLEGLNRPPWNRRIQTCTLAHPASTVAGEFHGWPEVCRRFGIAWPAGPRDAEMVSPGTLAALERATNLAALAWLRHFPCDLVQNQGAAFYRVARRVAPLPVVCTLHLARSLYPAALWRNGSPNLWLQCVSRRQHRDLRGLLREVAPGLTRQMTPPIVNGVPLEEYAPSPEGVRGNYLLYVGRIAPEKAPHLAIELARRGRRPLLLLGSVYPFPSHWEYFHREIEPHLGESVVWKPRPSLAEKRLWMAGAAAVVVPSQVEETSSLVAMEAAASGTPVLAFRRGALPETVAHGRTGFVCATLDQMERTLGRLPRLRRQDCRAWAEAHFDSQRMVADYARLYLRLAGEESGAEVASEATVPAT